MTHDLPSSIAGQPGVVVDSLTADQRQEGRRRIVKEVAFDHAQQIGTTSPEVVDVFRQNAAERRIEVKEIEFSLARSGNQAYDHGMVTQLAEALGISEEGIDDNPLFNQKGELSKAIVLKVVGSPSEKQPQFRGLFDLLMYKMQGTNQVACCVQYENNDQRYGFEGSDTLRKITHDQHFVA